MLNFINTQFGQTGEHLPLFEFYRSLHKMSKQDISKLNMGNSAWPTDGLESLKGCPVCGGVGRKLLHDSLTDRVFSCAPGIWSLHSCQNCGSGYLNPRPTPETIGLAYQNYYTHCDTPLYASVGLVEKIKRRLANGYRNYRYGTKDVPASYLGVFATYLMPTVRCILDAGMRHLPNKVKDGRILDFGCGNGAFLSRAQSAGWFVVGTDFDVKAVAAAKARGLDVRLGGTETLDSSKEQFDIVFLSHVIEHVHNPVELMESCFALLKPGGYLWIETPNISAQGHKLFGENWRGLEPPRHLVIFNFESLQNALKEVGFSKIETQPYRPMCRGLFSTSAEINNDTVSAEIVSNAEKIAKSDVSQREFITLKAWKI